MRIVHVKNDKANNSCVHTKSRVSLMRIDAILRLIVCDSIDSWCAIEDILWSCITCGPTFGVSMTSRLSPLAQRILYTASRCLLLTVFLFSIHRTPLLAQDPTIEVLDEPVLSLGRLSVGLSANYYFVPWNDLNDSFNAVRDAYAYNSVLGLTSGTVDRHRGDLVPSLNLSYRIAGPISLVVEGGMTITQAALDLRTSPTDHTFAFTPWSPTNYRNSFDLQLTGIGGGVSIDLPGSLRGRLRITAGSASASMDYEFIHDNADEVYRFNAALEDQSTYLSIGLDGVVPIAGPISLSLGAEYRSLRFAGLEGDGSVYHEYRFDPTSAVTTPFQARLVKAGSYYGIDVSGDWRAEGFAYVLGTPWRATPDTHVYAVPLHATPATLYLSGFSIRGGLTYAF